jgi:hypothetical protein
MKPYFRVATMAYLILLGATFGAVVFAGAVVAPVIFNSKEYLFSSILNHYQEGLLMTQNFIRLSYLVNLTMISIFLYEGYKYKMGERDKFTSSATLLAIMSGALFSFYYLPDIINMQLAGEAMTKTKEFINTHKGSEIDFKIFAFSLLALMILNMKKACK